MRPPSGSRWLMPSHAKRQARFVEGERDPFISRSYVAEVGDRSLPTALIFRDSFSTWLIPWLSEHFRRVRWEWLDDFQPPFSGQLVEEENPEVVIEILAERKLLLAPALREDDPAARHTSVSRRLPPKN